MKNPLELFRQGASQILSDFSKINDRMTKLNAERELLLSQPTRFSDWVAGQIQQIDAIADSYPGCLRNFMKNAFKYNGLNYSLEAYQQGNLFVRRSPLSTIGHGEVTGHPGPGDIAFYFMFREQAKKAFREAAEACRDLWPKDSECGAPVAERIQRIDAINIELDELNDKKLRIEEGLKKSGIQIMHKPDEAVLDQE